MAAIREMDAQNGAMSVKLYDKKTLSSDVSFLVRFTSLWALFVRKRKRKKNIDLTKVAQSVVNSSKNGKPILNFADLGSKMELTLDRTRRDNPT